MNQVASPLMGLYHALFVRLDIIKINMDKQYVYGVLEHNQQYLLVLLTSLTVMVIVLVCIFLFCFQ